MGLAPESVASEILERFCTGVDPGRLAVVETIHQSGSVVYRIVDVGGMLPDLALKLPRNSDPGEVEQGYRRLKQLEELRLILSRAPRALGYLDTPPSLLMTFEPGPSVTRLLEDPSHGAEAHQAIVRACGRALSELHRSLPVGVGAGGSGNGAAVVDRLLLSARRLRLGRLSTLRAAAARCQAVSRHRDYAADNLLWAGDGRVTIIDPPGSYEIAMPEIDLAWFNRQLSWRVATRASRLEEYERLRRCLLEGYAEHRGRGLSPEEEAVLLTWEATFLFNRLRLFARHRRLHQISAVAWLAFRRRRQARQALHALSEGGGLN